MNTTLSELRLRVHSAETQIRQIVNELEAFDGLEVGSINLQQAQTIGARCSQTVAVKIDLMVRP